MSEKSISFVWKSENNSVVHFNDFSLNVTQLNILEYQQRIKTVLSKKLKTY